MKKLQLVTTNSDDSDYDHTHRLLRDYFNERIKQIGPRDEQNLLEYCYHSLALGEYEPVVEMAFIQRQRPDRWMHVLKTVEQAPTLRLQRTVIEQKAANALNQARLHTDTEEAVRAIVLYTWLLASPGSEAWHVSLLWRNLETAYNYLQKADASIRHEMAAYCSQRAQMLHEKPVLPVEPDKTIPLIVPKLPIRQRAWRLGRGLYRGVLSSRRAQSVLAVVIAFTLVTWLLILPRLSLQPSIPLATDNPFTLPLATLQPSTASHK